MASAAFVAGSVALAGCSVQRDTPPAPVYHFGLKADSAAGAGSISVLPGDTIWRISQRYNLPQRAIIDLNGLMPPYDLAVGQRLRLPQPMEHKVGDQDTLTRIGRMYDVPLSQLARSNNLKKPYLLKVGQILRIPTTGRRLAEARKEEKQEKSAVSGPVGAAPSVMRKQPAPVQSETLAPPPVSQPPVSSPPAVAAVRPAATPSASVAPSSRGFIWPVRGKVISSYGAKAGNLFNDGINIAAPKGTPVAAAADGEVVYVGDDLKSYGNLVLLRHAGGMTTAYAHLGHVSVRKGMQVRQGQALGVVGSSGTVANAQLHFEMRKGMKTVDPHKYFN